MPVASWVWVAPYKVLQGACTHMHVQSFASWGLFIGKAERLYEPLVGHARRELKQICTWATYVWLMMLWPQLQGHASCGASASQLTQVMPGVGNTYWEPWGPATG